MGTVARASGPLQALPSLDHEGLPVPSWESSHEFCCGWTQGRLTRTDYFSINNKAVIQGVFFQGDFS